MPRSCTGHPSMSHRSRASRWRPSGCTNALSSCRSAWIIRAPQRRASRAIASPSAPVPARRCIPTRSVDDRADLRVEQHLGLEERIGRVPGLHAGRSREPDGLQVQPRRHLAVAPRCASVIIVSTSCSTLDPAEHGDHPRLGHALGRIPRRRGRHRGQPPAPEPTRAVRRRARRAMPSRPRPRGVRRSGRLTRNTSRVSVGDIHPEHAVPVVGDRARADGAGGRSARGSPASRSQPRGPLFGRWSSNEPGARPSQLERVASLAGARPSRRWPPRRPARRRR